MGNDQLRQAPDEATESPGQKEYERKIEKLPEIKDQQNRQEDESEGHPS
ncbi:hypothetical protein [Arenibaculum pallidiluteum]|nr:hypothetical protein [Arenibaculum pallidiluteum]